MDGTNDMATKFTEYVNETYPGTPVVTLSALLENEIVKARLEGGQDMAQEFMELYGLEETKLDELLEHCSNILNLQKFYTAGPTQVSSWFVEKGALAP